MHSDAFSFSSFGDQSPTRTRSPSLLSSPRKRSRQSYERENYSVQTPSNPSSPPPSPSKRVRHIDFSQELPSDSNSNIINLDDIPGSSDEEEQLAGDTPRQDVGAFSAYVLVSIIWLTANLGRLTIPGRFGGLRTCARASTSSTTSLQHTSSCPASDPLTSTLVLQAWREGARWGERALRRDYYVFAQKAGHRPS